MFFRTLLSIAACAGCLAQGASSPSIVVFLDFDRQPSDTSVSRMKEEVAAILRPSGLSLDWRMLKDSVPNESFPDLVVVKFRGSCQVRNPAMDSELGPSVQGAALATTVVSDGRILPYSDVKCDEIRRFLGSSLTGAGRQAQESVYGKALGRVLAHELYHIFAGTEVHARDGVARSFHTLRDLTASEFQFTPRENVHAARN